MERGDETRERKHKQRDCLGQVLRSGQWTKVSKLEAKAINYTRTTPIILPHKCRYYVPICSCVSALLSFTLCCFIRSFYKCLNDTFVNLLTSGADTLPLSHFTQHGPDNTVTLWTAGTVQ